MHREMSCPTCWRYTLYNQVQLKRLNRGPYISRDVSKVDVSINRTRQTCCLPATVSVGARYAAKALSHEMVGKLQSRTLSIAAMSVETNYLLA